MKYFTAIGLISLAGLCSAAPSAGAGQDDNSQSRPQSVTVDLGYAKYQGAFEAAKGVNEFHGIRFASPPIGNLRWRAPQLVGDTNIDGVLPATQKAPICVQTNRHHDPKTHHQDNSPDEMIGEEDCLFLDIIAPSQPASEKLPVLVNFQARPLPRSPEGIEVDEWLVQRSHGQLIHVTAHYRLGPYGFLDSKEVQADGTANAGLLDQRAALRWVQKYITKFGGDPERVVIQGFGVPAGNVIQQTMVHEGGENENNVPFRGIIASHPVSMPFLTEDLIQQQYQSLLQAAECQNLECLRSLSSDDLKDAIETMSERMVKDSDVPQHEHHHFGPTVDGKVIHQLPTEELSKDNFIKVPMMLNRVRINYDAISAEKDKTVNQLKRDLDVLFSRTGDDFVDRVLELYPESSYKSVKARQAAILSDALVNCPSTRAANALASADATVFKMIVNEDPEFLKKNANAQVNGQRIIDIISDWYLSFATNLNPNMNANANANANENAWPQYSKQSRPNYAVNSLNGTQISIQEDEDLGARCQFWNQAASVTRN